MQMISCCLCCFWDKLLLCRNKFPLLRFLVSKEYLSGLESRFRVGGSIQFRVSLQIENRVLRIMHFIHKIRMEADQDDSILQVVRHTSQTRPD